MYTGPPSSLGAFMKATLPSPKQTVRPSSRARTNKTLATCRQGFGLQKAASRCLRTVAPQTQLALVWVPSSCDTNVWTRLCQSPLFAELRDTRENPSSSPARDSYLLPLIRWEGLQSVSSSTKEPLSHCRFGTCSLRVVPRGRTGALLQASSQPFLTGDNCQVAVQLAKGVAADRLTGLPHWDPLPSAWACHPCAHHPTRLVNCRSSKKPSETRFC